MTVFTTATDNRPKGEDLVKLRIAAKANLWTFLNEIKDQLSVENLNRDEVIQEVSRTALRMLHPHFSYSEMVLEIENMLDTIVVPGSKQIANSFASDMVAMIFSPHKKPRDDEQDLIDTYKGLQP